MANSNTEQGPGMQDQNPDAASLQGATADQPIRFRVTTVTPPRFGLPLVRDFVIDTLGTLDRLSRAGDVVQLKVGWQRIHFLFHPELLRTALLEDEGDLVKEDRQLRVFALVHGRSVVTTVGDDWKRQRKLLGAAFGPRQVSRYLDLMRSAAMEANRTYFSSSPPSVIPFDPSVYASQITMDVMLRVLFSETGDRQESAAVTRSVSHLASAAQEMFGWPWVPAGWMPFPGRGALMHHRGLLRERIRRHIEHRRAAPPPEGDVPADLIDAMLLAEDTEAVAGQPTADRRLSAGEVEDNCVTLFLGGIDTSASALTWWMAYMAAHPEHAQRAREEVAQVMGTDWVSGELDPGRLASLTFVEATLKEAMRLRPPIVGPFNRRAQRDISLYGHQIRRGDLVSGSIWTLHHDERWFPEPETFNPDRFMPGAPSIPRGALMPFGSGPHVCLGQHFAMLEMKLVTALLLSQVAWNFPPGETMPAPRVDVTIKPCKPMQLIATPIMNSN